MTTELRIPIIPRAKNHAKNKIKFLMKDVSAHNMRRILFDDEWPEKPFIDIAEKNGLVRSHFVHSCELVRFQGLVNKFSNVN